MNDDKQNNNRFKENPLRKNRNEDNSAAVPYFTNYTLKDAPENEIFNEHQVKYNWQTTAKLYCAV